MPERAVGQNRVGTPSASPSGSGRQPPPGPDRRAPGRRSGTERVAEPELAAQVGGLGPAAEEAVGPDVDGAAAERRSLRSVPPRRGDASSSTTVGRAVAGRAGAAGQLPGGGQAADAAADDRPTRRTVGTSGASPVGRRRSASARTADEAGVVVERRGAGEGEPGSAATRPASTSRS